MQGRQSERRSFGVASLAFVLALSLITLVGGGWFVFNSFRAPSEPTRAKKSAVPREIPGAAQVTQRKPVAPRPVYPAEKERYPAQNSPRSAPASGAGLLAPILSASQPLTPPLPQAAATVELSPPVVPSPSAERGATTHGVLWRRPGLCANDSGTDPSSPRARYLASFQKLAAPWEQGLFAYARAPAEVIEAIRLQAPALPARIEAFLGLETEIPAIYLHKDPESLRAYGCVNASAVAYYDGSIHLSISGASRFREELTKSLDHEYVHHALLSDAVERPIWFQEGAAMTFAKESWVGYRFVAEAIPLPTMVEAFAHTAQPEAAEAFYLQAYAMVRLLADVWQEPNETSESDLVNALSTGQATPETLFEWALRERVPTLETDPATLIESYIRKGFQLDPNVPL